ISSAPRKAGRCCNRKRRMAEDTQQLGIIAGGGGLPRRLIAACRENKRPFFVLALKGQTDKETVADVPHRWVRLGAVDAAIDILKSENVKDVVLGGSVRRPGIFDMKPDL